ncbi:MAG: hypothetical protein ACMG6E_10815 [Candidatus Roizmanbacteria bacterium]
MLNQNETPPAKDSSGKPRIARLRISESNRNMPLPYIPKLNYLTNLAQ